MSIARIVRLAAAASLLAATVHAAHPATELWVPAARRGKGVGTSVWRTDLVILNPGEQTALVDLYWLVRDRGNTDAAPVRVSVPPGASLALDDVIATTLGMSEGSGAFRVAATAPVVVQSRIASLGGSGTFGQGLEGMPTAAAIAAGGALGRTSATAVGGVRSDTGSRANAYALAVDRAGAELTVEVVGADGSILGVRTLALEGWEPVLFALDTVTGGASFENATVRFSVASGAALVGVSSVDNATNDPTTREPWWQLATPAGPGVYTGQVLATVPGGLTAVVEQHGDGLAITTLAAGLVVLSPDDGGTGCSDAYSFVLDGGVVPIAADGTFAAEIPVEIERNGAITTLTLSWQGVLRGATISGVVDIAVSGAGTCSGTLRQLSFLLARSE